MTDQLIHCYVSQLSTQRRFYVTYVYGRNQEHLRQPLWDDLQTLATQINEAWCILGDFNTVLHKEDRIGGIEVQDHEVKHLADFMDTCEVQELRWTGLFYSWTNKTIWSRIDRVFTNLLWHDTMDFTQTSYLPYGLSDHTPLIIIFPTSPRPRPSF